MKKDEIKETTQEKVNAKEGRNLSFQDFSKYFHIIDLRKEVDEILEKYRDNE